ncbi:unnamed protein product, partial [Iphiclides podalirius]
MLMPFDLCSLAEADYLSEARLDGSGWLGLTGPGGGMKHHTLHTSRLIALLYRCHLALGWLACGLHQLSGLRWSKRWIAVNGTC